MPKDIVIIGCGGLAQEILWCIMDINGEFPKWNVVGFASELPEDAGKEFHGYEVFDVKEVKTKRAAIGFADPQGKARFINKYDFEYPNLIHPEAKLTMKNKLGSNGVVIFAGSKLMPCSSIGDFSYLNVNVVIGHDTVIGQYCSISPSAAIMGNCTVGARSYIGVNSCTREKIKIGEGCVIGAGAAVVSNIPDYSLAVGVPAKVIKKMV